MEKICFYDEMASAEIWKGWMNSCFPWKISIEMRGKESRIFRVCGGGGTKWERNVKEKRLVKFCDEKELRVANGWFQKKEKENNP